MGAKKAFKRFDVGLKIGFFDSKFTDDVSLDFADARQNFFLDMDVLRRIGIINYNEATHRIKKYGSLG